MQQTAVFLRATISYFHPAALPNSHAPCFSFTVLCSSIHLCPAKNKHTPGYLCARHWSNNEERATIYYPRHCFSRMLHSLGRTSELLISGLWKQIQTLLELTFNILCIGHTHQSWEKQEFRNGLTATGLTSESQKTEWQEKENTNKVTVTSDSAHYVLSEQHICPCNAGLPKSTTCIGDQTVLLYVKSQIQTGKEAAPLGKWQKCHSFCSPLRLKDRNMSF